MAYKRFKTSMIKPSSYRKGKSILFGGLFSLLRAGSKMAKAATKENNLPEKDLVKEIKQSEIYTLALARVKVYIELVSRIYNEVPLPEVRSAAEKILSATHSYTKALSSRGISVDEHILGTLKQKSEQVKTDKSKKNYLQAIEICNQFQVLNSIETTIDALNR